MLVPNASAAGERTQSNLELWQVGNTPTYTSGVLKATPAVRELTGNIPQPSYLRLEADTALSCDGYWQGEPAVRSVGWVIGLEIYAVYQDPAEMLCVNTYPFTVTDIYWIVVVDYAQWLRMQPVIASNGGTVECPIPDSLLCIAPTDSLFLDVGTWLVQMTLDFNCVVAEPYFACVYLPDEVSVGTVDLVFDDAIAAGVPCRAYDDWGQGWQDMSQSFPNLILWSEGSTEDLGVSCACDCHADPQCDGLTNVLDVVKGVNVAFRGTVSPPDPNVLCPYYNTDVNCDGVTNVLDVVQLVNVAFRGADGATQFCAACP
jgi:hypothetical protein